MNKDALMATIIGFFIGIIITSGILFGPKLVKSIHIALPKIQIPALSFKSNPKKTTEQTKNSLEKNSNTSTSFSIDGPVNESISDADTILVSGKAHPGSFVLIAGLDDETAVQVKSDGKYAGKITLVEGKNTVSVTEFLQTNQTTESISVYYIDETL